jgi:hypothetical protein
LSAPWAKFSGDHIWLVISAALAVLAFGLGPLRWLIFADGGDVPDSYALSLAIWLGWAWIFSFAVAVANVGCRAFWLLLAAPFALYWPFMWIFVAGACDVLGRC